MSEPEPVLRNAGDLAAHEKSYTQRLNPESLFRCVPLSRLAGMSAPGRPKREYRSAQHEGAPGSAPGRPKREYRSAQHEGAPVRRAHVTLARLPPGRHSFACHAHLLEEERVYILAGRGIAEIGGAEREVGPDDFMGFATPSVAHLLRNPFAEELVYLMGGEDLPLDVLDHPKLGKRYLLLPAEGGTQFYELGDPIRPFGRVDKT